MYVFGGYDKVNQRPTEMLTSILLSLTFVECKDGFECNDLYEFNFFTNAWRKVKTKGIIPKDRYDSSVHIGQ